MSNECKGCYLVISLLLIAALMLGSAALGYVVGFDDAEKQTQGTKAK